jgi:hypothetical protein
MLYDLEPDRTVTGTGERKMVYIFDNQVKPQISLLRTALLFLSVTLRRRPQTIFFLSYYFLKVQK